MFIRFIITVVLVEAITELVVKGKIFRRIRELFSKNRFLKELLVCGYCVAFWISIFCVILLNVRLVFSNDLGIIVAVFVVHRCASHLHDLTHIFVQHQKCKER